MELALDRGAGTLRLGFADAEALRSFVESWQATDGCLVRLPEELKLWAPLTVELSDGGASRLRVAARVVQVFGGGRGGFATALQAADEEARAALSAAASAAATGTPAAADPPAGGETQGVSPALRIRRLNVTEKMRLATKADRTERQILLRDSSPQVLTGLLANPRLEDKEVVALCKSSSASGGVLQRIAKDKRWAASYEVRLALVKNPQTPSPLALRLLETLRERDLRMLAKGSNVREAIKGAALRLVIKRGG